MDNPPPDAAQETEALQKSLDAAMASLSRAGDDKAFQGCLGAAGGTISCFGIFIAMGVTVCTATPSIPGFLLAAAAIAGLVKSVSASRVRPESQDDAEQMIVSVGSLLSGVETLRVHESDRARLHQLLYRAPSRLAIAILRILAVVGDGSSLRLVNILSGAPPDGRLFSHDAASFASGFDPAVHAAATEAEIHIRRRLELARQSSSLLRPSGASRDQELLRPAAVSGGDDPELLLRAEPTDTEDG